MRQITGVILVSIVLMTHLNGCSSLQKRRLADLNAKHPFALLGDDFGILNEDDLASNACEAEPQPFSSHSISYPHWQCFEARAISFLCDHSGEPQPPDNVQALIVLTSSDTNHAHEYLARRPMDLADCKTYEADWNALTEGEKHVCISGPLIREGHGAGGKRETFWVFDKFKTRKGCIPYFEGGCDLKYQLTQGCTISPTMSSTNR